MVGDGFDSPWREFSLLLKAGNNKKVLPNKAARAAHPPPAAQNPVFCAKKKLVLGLKKATVFCSPIRARKTRRRTKKEQNQSRANRHKNMGIPAIRVAPGGKKRTEPPRRAAAVANAALTRMRKKVDPEATSLSRTQVDSDQHRRLARSGRPPQGRRTTEASPRPVVSVGRTGGKNKNRVAPRPPSPTPPLTRMRRKWPWGDPTESTAGRL